MKETPTGRRHGEIPPHNAFFLSLDQAVDTAMLLCTREMSKFM